MPRIVELPVGRALIVKDLSRSFQSGHINFLLGSGASFPAIPIAGGIEQQIADQFAAGHDDQARATLYGFMAAIQAPTNRLIDDTLEPAESAALQKYSDLLSNIEILLVERRTNLLPKQATIFTTNYDLFLEKASLGHSTLKLNDGFNRVPSLKNRMEFSSRNFFDTTYNTGPHYSYKVEVPSINLVKLHGSMSWKAEASGIVFSVERRDLLVAGASAALTKEFVDRYAVVLPQTSKFRTTLMDRNYYDLLRLYANEIDRENALFLAFGFSFGDEHILDITRRSLKNPTSRLVIFAHNAASVAQYQARFSGYSNVHLICPAPGEAIGFGEFNAIVRESVPVRGGA